MAQGFGRRVTVYAALVVLGIVAVFGLKFVPTAYVTYSYLGNGTVFTCWDGPPSNDYIDFNNDLVPSPIPSGSGPNYYLNWTCPPPTCPGYSGTLYQIIGATDGGCWNPKDCLQLSGWDVCTGPNTTEATGWTFDVLELIPPPTEWPQVQRNEINNGTISQAGPVTNSTRWVLEGTGAVWSGFSVVNNTVYFATYEQSPNYVCAVDATTGELNWSAPMMGLDYGSFHGTPTYYNGLVIVPTRNTSSAYSPGRVFAFNATTGSPVWMHDSDAGGHDYSGVVANGKFYIGSRENPQYGYNPDFYIINATTGVRICKHDKGISEQTQCHFYSVIPAVAGGRAYTYCTTRAATTGQFMAFNDGDCSLEWITPAKGSDLPGVATCGMGQNAMHYEGGFVYALHHCARWFKINAATGAYTAGYDWESGGSYNYGPRATAMDSSYLYSADYTSQSGSRDLNFTAINKSDISQKIWSWGPFPDRSGPAGSLSTMVMGGDIAYFTIYSDSPNMTMAINVTSRQNIWNYTFNNANSPRGPIALYNGTLFVGANDSVLAFGSGSASPTIEYLSPDNGYIVDRSGIRDDYDDYAVLVARISSNSSDVPVKFYTKRNAPTTGGTTYLGNNTTNSSGIATFKWDPDESTTYAGNYSWWAASGICGSIADTPRYVYLYGGLNVSFMFNDTFPNSSYESGDIVEVQVNITSLSPETQDDLVNNYNAQANATLRPPTQSPKTFSLTNISKTTTSKTVYGNGTAYSCIPMMEGFIDIDTTDDIVPSMLPNDCWEYGISGYYLNWTCNSTTCPGESGESYGVWTAGDNDTFCGSWNNLDWLEISKLACPIPPDPLGWEFEIYSETTTTQKYWGGNYTLSTEGGSWSADVDASADWFFSGSNSRGFSVPVEEVVVVEEEAAAPEGAAPKRSLEMSIEEIEIKEGKGYISIERGGEEEVELVMNNTGTISLYDLNIEITGIPEEWFQLEKESIEELTTKEGYIVRLKFNIPADAEPGEYEATVTMSNVYVKMTRSFVVDVPSPCLACAAPSEWTDCIGGKRGRTTYTCSAETGYKCQEVLEEEACAVPAARLPWEWVAAGIVVVAGAVYMLRKGPRRKLKK
ncbi:MAG: PQQ-binding-like beta-propeller repeat protein [Candidatus Aenigmatarchaeota archaeon]